SLSLPPRYAVIDRLRDMDCRMDELANLLRQQQKAFKQAEATTPEAAPAKPSTLPAPPPMQSKAPESPRPEPVKIPTPVEAPIVVERRTEPILPKVGARNTHFK